jgi:hypothetical protein
VDPSCFRIAVEQRATRKWTEAPAGYRVLGITGVRPYRCIISAALHPVRRTTRRSLEQVGDFTEILRSQLCRRYYAYHSCSLITVVVESVHGSSGNAERLSRPNLNALPINSEGQHSVETVTCLFIAVMAMVGSW